MEPAERGPHFRGGFIFGVSSSDASLLHPPTHALQQNIADLNTVARNLGVQLPVFEGRRLQDGVYQCVLWWNNRRFRYVGLDCNQQYSRNRAAIAMWDILNSLGLCTALRARQSHPPRNSSSFNSTGHRWNTRRESRFHDPFPSPRTAPPYRPLHSSTRGLQSYRYRYRGSPRSAVEQRLGGHVSSHPGTHLAHAKENRIPGWDSEEGPFQRSTLPMETNPFRSEHRNGGSIRARSRFPDKRDSGLKDQVHSQNISANRSKKGWAGAKKQHRKGSKNFPRRRSRSQPARAPDSASGTRQMIARGAWQLRGTPGSESLERLFPAFKSQVNSWSEDRTAAIIDKYFTKTKKEEEEAVQLLSSRPTFHNHPNWSLKYVPVGEWVINRAGKRVAPEGSCVSPMRNVKRKV